MKKTLLIFFLAGAVQFCQAQANGGQATGGQAAQGATPGRDKNASPHQLYPGLFEAVQLNDVFPDNKTFVDMTPRFDPAVIMKSYNRQKNTESFDLKQFVAQNFSMPAGSGINFKSEIGKGIRKHIDTLWTVLDRHSDTVSGSSLLALRYNYIIPGGRFREIYYWDSYFSMLGLQESGKISIIDDMIRNFGNIIDRYGFIPNGTRTYYLTRSQPPFFSLMIDLLAKDRGDTIYTHYTKELTAEYAFWMQGAETLASGRSVRNLIRMPDGGLLNRYWDSSEKPREESYKQDFISVKATKQAPGTYFRNIRAAAESGWDFSTRWFDESGQLATIHTTDLAAIDLNCLLYHLEQTLAKTATLNGDAKMAELYRLKAENRKNEILKYCWDENDGWFKDYNFRLKRVEKIETLAGIYPLEFNIATRVQAEKLAEKVKITFLKPGGLVTTNNASGQQWDSPNGWAPLQYMTIDGLAKYGFSDLATTIARRWIALNLQVFRQTGKLVEKYNVIDLNMKAGGGEYSLQDGFGWTNGVLLNLMDRFDSPASLSSGKATVNEKPGALKNRPHDPGQKVTDSSRATHHIE